MTRRALDTLELATPRWLGIDLKPPVHVPEEDKRFADPTWNRNPAFFAMRQDYRAASQLASDLLAAGEGDPVGDAKAQLATGFLLDALAPANFLFTNPAALKRALETDGASGAGGAGNRSRPARQRRPPPPGGHPASGSGRDSRPCPARSCSRTI
jgi:polyhydroxyalkanoate synthase subunit PhaC